MTEPSDEQMELIEHAVMTAYKKLVDAGIGELEICHAFIGCGLSLLATVVCPEHLSGELAHVRQGLEDAEAEMRSAAQ